MGERQSPARRSRSRLPGDRRRQDPLPVSDREPAARQPLNEEVARANAELARVEQIKSFRILPKELDPEQEGEAVTPTRKIKRKLIHEQFKPLVDDMYGESEERMVAASTGNALRG